MPLCFSSLLLFLSLLILPTNYAELIILEDGYTVSTLIDGNEMKINPRALLPYPGSSDLIVLDSFHSRFYTVSLTTSRVTELSGDGKRGYLDGESGQAQFDQPRSFALDNKGNIYVADRANHAIRKISNSVVTTIAGGYSKKDGKADGPGKNATFSNDIEVVFAAKKCALLISDHGNRLVRQIGLKPEDCATSSQFALGAVQGLGISCLLGVVIGIVIGMVIRPYVIRNTGRLQPSLVQQDMEALPNQSSENSTDTLLRHQKRSC